MPDREIALIYAVREGGHSHLYAHLPGRAESMQLTAGDWDDIDPATSPDGSKLAFSSNRGSGWELYLLDLASGEMRALTSTAGFEAHPTWSPDGLWLAFEAYYEEDFDIWILPVDGSQPAIQLTDHPAADWAPTWDPNGRRIAFISDRSGQPDVYLADLDSPSDRFRNLSNTADLSEQDPAFSPEGDKLAFSVLDQGVGRVGYYELSAEGDPPTWVGQGTCPAWAPNGGSISAILATPLVGHLVSYPLDPSQIVQGTSLFGRLHGIDWAALAMPVAIQEPTESKGVLYDAHFTIGTESEGRVGLVPLENIHPPGLSLSDKVDEAFLALRQAAQRSLGWDFLGNLDYAFVGLNDPLPPGFAYNDWLYTGRAIAFSQAAFQAGWVEVVREDYGASAYWRVFVRAAAQDGSQGSPLRQPSWDFSTRFDGDPSAYDRGGSLKSSIPSGYYVDFTELAADYGFERLPALHNWRTYFPAARFNEFALIDGLTWTQAMLELYPQSAIATPTPYQTPTQTPTNTPRPTPTPWWWRWRTPTYTPTPSDTPTPTGTP